MSPNRIIHAILDAFADSGATAVYLPQPRRQTHPRRFLVNRGEDNFEVWIYFWTLTHGGGERRPRDEYRIQLTGVQPPLARNARGPTLLLGYEPNIGCFAGFDLARHHAFSLRSPSIQVNINTIRQAHENGFAFTRKGNDEIAIGFRPDHLLAYCLNAEVLHRLGADAGLPEILNQVARSEIPASGVVAGLSEERQRIISTVSRLRRATGFSRSVAVAYERRCCVTAVQLRLIDAAHILPVGAEGSVDTVNNGLCLAPTYHRAYDRGLIYLDESLRMRICPEKRAQLVADNLAGGVEYFAGPLNRRILLPADRRQWPDTDMIRRGNLLRGCP